jgi:Mor family transcriptional regulator
VSQAAFRLEPEAAAELAGNVARTRDDARWPQLIVDLIEVQTAALVHMGLPEEQAERYARAMVIAQSLYQGGRHLYLPRGKQLEQALRDDEIYRAHRRGNTEALARRYDLTERQVQNIVKRQLELHRARVQMPLFAAR